MGTAVKDLEVGYELKPLVKRIDQPDIDLFEAFGLFEHPNIHTDPEAAKAAGVGSIPIASGRMTTAYATEALARFFGETYYSTGQADMTFIRPIKDKDVLTVYGRIREKIAEGKGTRVVVELWVENQDGNKTAVGSGSALVT